MSPRHLRPTPTARKVSRAVTIPVVLAIAVAGIATPAFAGKPDRGTTSTASCSAAPSPVGLNTDYTLTIVKLAAYDIVNVLVTDPASTRTWNLQADDAGTISVVGHAYTSGYSKVTVQKPARNHGFTTVTTCGFTVS